MDLKKKLSCESAAPVMLENFIVSFSWFFSCPAHNYTVWFHSHCFNFQIHQYESTSVTVHTPNLEPFRAFQPTMMVRNLKSWFPDFWRPVTNFTTSQFNCTLENFPSVISCADDSFSVTVNAKSLSLTHLSVSQFLNPVCIPTAASPPPSPRPRSSCTRIPLTLSPCLFVLTSLTTLLATLCQSFGFFSHGGERSRAADGMDLHPFWVFHLTASRIPVAKPSYSSTNIQRDLHSYAPCACCCSVCLASTTDC